MTTTVQVDNPYWDALSPHVTVPGKWEAPYRQINRDYDHGELDRRGSLCRRYTWAIPTPEDIAWMVGQVGDRTVVEIGAGTGYWAWLLQQAGVHVRAYDKAPPGRKGSRNFYHSPRTDAFDLTDDAGEQFSPVKQGSAYYAGMWPDAVLYLSWPPYSDAMADEAPDAYTGDFLIYCGEGQGGCTADDDFHDALESDWDLVSTSRGHAQWWGIHDTLESYRRKAR